MLLYTEFDEWHAFLFSFGPIIIWLVMSVLNDLWK